MRSAGGAIERIGDMVQRFAADLPRLIGQIAQHRDEYERSRLELLRERWPGWPDLEHDPLEVVRNGLRYVGCRRPVVFLCRPAGGGVEYIRTPYETPERIAAAIWRAAARADGTWILLEQRPTADHHRFIANRPDADSAGRTIIEGPPWPFDGVLL